MRLMVETKRLAEAVDILSKLTQKKAYTAYMTVFRIEADEQIKVYASDLETQARATVPADVSEPGTLHVEAALFAEILKNLKTDTVHIEVSGDTMLMRSRKTRFKLPLVDTDYPDFATTEPQVELPISTLASMLDRVIYAAATDELMKNFNGVYWDVREGNLRLVASDGFRLALVETEADVSFVSFLAPLKSMQVLRGLLSKTDADRIQIGFAGKTIHARMDGYELNFRLKDAEFPNYERVVPERHVTWVSVDTLDLENALKRLRVISKDVVRFRITPDVLTLIARDAEKGEGQEDIDLIGFEGEELEIAFNPRFILDFLKHASEKVFLEFTGKDSAVKIYSDDEKFFNVIMPVRVV